MDCRHRDVVEVFTESAVCQDCGEPVCARCRSPECRAAYWQAIVNTGAWRGVAINAQDASRTLESARLVCWVISGRR